MRANDHPLVSHLEVMKLVYFSYINDSLPVLYVLNEITRGLVLVSLLAEVSA